MPALLIAAAVVAVLLAKRASAAQALPSTPYQLAPGAAAYLPPINAPEAFRILYANAAASRNPIQMVQAAQALMQAGQAELARALSSQYQALTNQPIPGVAGWFGGHGVVGAPMMDRRMVQALRLYSMARRARRQQQQQRVAAALRRLRLARSA